MDNTLITEEEFDNLLIERLKKLAAREEMKNLLEFSSNYYRLKDESPKAARDLRKVIKELERLWKIEDELYVVGKV